jgi:hypothetical protein
MQSQDILRQVYRLPSGDWQYESARAENLMFLALSHSRQQGRLARVLRGAVLCGIIGLGVLPHTIFGRQVSDGVTLTATPEKSEIVLHEPVYATFSVHNDTKASIRFNLGRNNKGLFSFSVTLPTSQTLQIPKLAPPPEGGLHFVGEPLLKPGQQYTQRLLLNEWHNFPSPGTYRVTLNTEIRFQTNTSQPVRTSGSTTFVVQVAPQDNARLARVCSELAAQALSGAGVQPRVDAAFALSLVRDPVAIPYLGQLLEKGKSVEQYGISGLDRIGTSEAMDVLLSNVQRAGPELRQQMIAVLRRVEASTSDQNLRTRIRAALQQ